MYNNLIYTNGCSFTEGGFYENKTDCWPWKINVKGYDVLNDAIGGGSNYRIMRTCMDTVTRMHGRIFVAIIQWTGQGRAEQPGGDSFIRINLAESVEHNPLEPSRAVLIENWLDQINVLDRFFTVLNIPVYFFNGFTNINSYTIDNKLDKERIEKKFKTIDRKKWILPPETSLKEWIDDKSGKAFLSDGHLKPEKNIIIADKIRGLIFDNDC